MIAQKKENEQVSLQVRIVNYSFRVNNSQILGYEKREERKRERKKERNKERKGKKGR